MFLPFSFLEFDKPAPQGIIKHLILIGSQMIKTQIPQGVIEVEEMGDIWILFAETDFSTRSIGPILSGTFFKGRGGVKREESNILSSFETTFLLNSEHMNDGLLDFSMDDPERFLRYFEAFCK